MNSFILNITASSGEFYQGSCESMVLPVKDGVYGVQAGHSPVLVAIHMGMLKFTVDGETREILVGDGMETMYAVTSAHFQIPIIQYGLLTFFENFFIQRNSHTVCTEFFCNFPYTIECFRKKKAYLFLVFTLHDPLFRFRQICKYPVILPFIQNFRNQQVLGQ